MPQSHWSKPKRIEGGRPLSHTEWPCWSSWSLCMAGWQSEHINTKYWQFWINFWTMKELEYLSENSCGYCLDTCLYAYKRNSLDDHYFMVIFALKVEKKVGISSFTKLQNKCKKLLKSALTFILMANEPHKWLPGGWLILVTCVVVLCFNDFFFRQVQTGWVQTGHITFRGRCHLSIEFTFQTIAIGRQIQRWENPFLWIDERCQNYLSNCDCLHYQYSHRTCHTH